MRVLTTREIAEETGVNERGTRRTLTRLESAGLVERVGARSGWKLTDAGERFVGLPPSTAQAAAGDVAATVSMSKSPDQPSGCDMPHKG